MHCKMVFDFTVHQKLSKAKMTAHWSKKLDPYWSIEDMMKTNKSILAVNNFNTECYVIQSKKCNQK